MSFTGLLCGLVLLAQAHNTFVVCKRIVGYDETRYALGFLCNSDVACAIPKHKKPGNGNSIHALNIKSIKTINSLQPSRLIIN